MNYLGAKYDMKPSDPDLVYHGEKITAWFLDDFQKKHFNYPVWYASEEDKPALYEKVFSTHLPACLKKLEELLTTKFICGE